MSLFDYILSREIEEAAPPFYALIMAAMRRADSNNIVLLRQVFPDVYDELEARYHCPGGKLTGE